MRIAVHRGGGTGPLQNTLEGIKRAVESGADWVEVDVHFSSDGVPFLRHDRWINGRNVFELPSEKLISSGIDPLSNALEAFDVTFYIDLKGGFRETLIPIIDGHDVVIGSFNGLILRDLKERGFRTSLIFSAVLSPRIIDEIAGETGADYVNPGWEHHLPSHYVSLLGEIHTPVISWTENNEEVFRTLFSVADVVMTDRLDLVRKYKRFVERM